MHQLLQPRRADNVADTVESEERWEYDIREYEARFSKALDDDVKIGVILSLAPTAVQSRCHLSAPALKSYGAVRQVVMDCRRAQADVWAWARRHGRLRLGKGEGRQAQGHRQDGQ